MSGEYDELVKRLRAGNFDTESIANEAADAIRALTDSRDEWKSQCEQWAQKASEWAVEKEQWEARLAVVHNRLYLSRSSSCAAIARALAAEQSRDALAKAIQTIVTTGARDERTLLGVTQGIVLVDEKDFDALRSLIEALDNG
jgi:hypothetical protein